ncbi:MAG TPA: response regulator [Terriglobales bacterium]|nr:response regulator [Terriglobales bacterium]
MAERKRLLFVDDEANIRLTLPVILAQEGFEVTAAASVPEALELITKEKFDVLLSDLNIGSPGDGFTVVSAMRRTQPDAVTFILTGYPDFETALEALRSQVDDYLTKPADIRYLVTRINEKLGKPGRIEHVSAQRASVLIREHAQSIIAEWLRLISEDDDLSRIPLTKKDRVDHLPVFLEEMANRIDSERLGGKFSALDAAHKHGRLRRKQGYSIPQLIAEARIMHSVVSQCLQAHLLSIDLSTIISDLVRIGEALNEQLEHTVRAFASAIRVLSIAYDPILEVTRADVLRQAGYDVVSVVGTDKGRKAAEKSVFDLVVIGHSAPRAERTTLLKWLKAHFQRAHFIVLTKPHEGKFDEADCTCEPDPQELLDTISRCAPLTPSIRND